MSNERLHDKARKLVELTGAGRSLNNNASKQNPEGDPRAKHESMLIEMQIELRAKHMSAAQLDALLGFYTSEMGQSILAAQERIRAETSERMAALVVNSSSIAVRVPKPTKGDSDMSNT